MIQDICQEMAERVIADLESAPLDSPTSAVIVAREAIGGVLRSQMATLFDALAVEKRACKSCGVMLWFVKTAKDNLMPVSPNLTSHFADCPNAAHHRKPKPPMQQELVAAVGYPE